MITGNLPIMSKNITCAITGHRLIESGFDFERLKSDLTEIYDLGYRIFLCGMAKGFDTICFKALSILKTDYPDIKICAVVPCSTQSKYLSESERAEYFEMLAQADYIEKEDKPYFNGCMLIRNDHMIKHSSYLYAYFNGEKKGGTYYTVNRARKNCLEIKFYPVGENS